MAFQEDISGSTTIRNNLGGGEKHGLEFQADLHLPVEDLLGGEDTVDHVFISLNGAADSHSVRQRTMRVRPGVRTIVRVSIVSRNVTDDVRDMDVSDRKCRLRHENEGMEVFGAKYTQKGCQFECQVSAFEAIFGKGSSKLMKTLQMKTAARICRCIPWNYPNPVWKGDDATMTTCDLYGALCFEKVMDDDDDNAGGSACDCPQNCEDLAFSYNLQEVSLDTGALCYNAYDVLLCNQ